MAANKAISYAAALSGPQHGLKRPAKPSQADSLSASPQKLQNQTQWYQLKDPPGASSIGNPSSPQGPYTASTYQRHSDHMPRTSPPSEEAYILSLKTDKAHHAALTALRDRYFPRHLNKLSAHIALFRALPGSKLEEISHDIASLSQEQHAFPIKTSSPYRLKHGVGIGVSSGAMESKVVFEDLRSKWEAFLSKQDNAGFRAHYTIMNKMEDEQEVGRCLEEVKRSFEASDGIVDGLILWRYEKGYWRFLRAWEFRREGK
ncbi:hypothetical protein GJ744_011924 [Endocarpon pusillum]|uniref:Uncharacterized protein n=1 Tax=Endocarpon pusillum TaxID=364733 RepID=A0A8H7ATE3_9EURO|nr:hypothetical protein GJ744_011924 [Endocarpon pusillum]